MISSALALLTPIYMPALSMSRLDFVLGQTGVAAIGQDSTPSLQTRSHSIC